MSSLTVSYTHLTSQVQLTEAELTYNQSIYDYLVAKADLDQVLGKDYIAENEE